MAAPAAAPADFIKIADKYERDVLSGRIPACGWVKKACQRNAGDKKRAATKAWPYRFDAAKATKVCKFVQLLSHTKGRWAAKRERIRLEPWQVWLTCCVFGWVHKKTGFRRFRRVFLLIPRKNGKSLLAAAWGLYMLCADGEHGAEVYSGATSEKQAWEVFGPMRLMAQKNPDLLAHFGLAVNASNLHISGNASKAEPIIGNPGDGSSPSCAIHDEYHEHDDDKQVDTMVTGMGARDQPLQVIVTTAGDNLAGPCYSMQLDVQNVLDGVFDNDELFACIWTIDKGDDWNTVEALKKANPNFGVSINEDFLRARLAEAKMSPRKAGIFQTKHLNVWVQSREAYFNVIKWQELANPKLSLLHYKGKTCVITLDLSSKIDITAMCIMFANPPDVEKLTGKRYTVFMRYYLPEETAYAPENEKYRDFESAGCLTITDGAMIDISLIRDDLYDLKNFLDVEAVGIDPWHAQQLMVELMNEGVPVIEYGQTVNSMSAPMKELDAVIRAGLVEHEGDPCTTWMMSNVTAKTDAKDNVYPRKERPENKIDGPVAKIMAIGIHTNGQKPMPSVYEERGLAEVGV
ncbi:terminase large subunit [Caulobacter phage TMCBR2]|uniref:Terminase large subunit n=1 Tax=Caulobacter phage TMCBR2 TaxID=3025404 RepID=A0AAE9YJP5_9CAUD|nr:terminase large subunit [Caulobacter phage TMCBR2]WDS38251.1 terminase large subunit [Caulobacter phage TMCBR3]